jgi:NADPH:quinone reductase-like Zn-dependent oxidoreductase
MGVDDQQQESHRRASSRARRGPAFPRRAAEAGAFKPVIDRRYPFAQIAGAHSYVDTGRKKGNVIITLEHAAAPRIGTRS